MVALWLKYIYHVFCSFTRLNTTLIGETISLFLRLFDSIIMIMLQIILKYGLVSSIWSLQVKLSEQIKGH